MLCTQLVVDFTLPPSDLFLNWEFFCGFKLQLGTVDQGVNLLRRLGSLTLVMFWRRSDYPSKAQSKTTGLHINRMLCANISTS